MVAKPLEHVVDVVSKAYHTLAPTSTAVRGHRLGANLASGVNEHYIPTAQTSVGRTIERSVFRINQGMNKAVNYTLGLGTGVVLEGLITASTTQIPELIENADKNPFGPEVSFLTAGIIAASRPLVNMVLAEATPYGQEGKSSLRNHKPSSYATAS